MTIEILLGQRPHLLSNSFEECQKSQENNQRIDKSRNPVSQGSRLTYWHASTPEKPCCLKAWLSGTYCYAVNRATGVRGALRSRFRKGRTWACTGVIRCRLMTGSVRFPHMMHRYARIQSSPMLPLISRQSSTTISPLHRAQFITLPPLKASCFLYDSLGECMHYACHRKCGRP